MEVTFSKGIFSRSWNTGPRRRGIVENIIDKQEQSIAQHLCKFKYHQTLVPVTQEYRLISAACSYCLPHSARQFDDELKAMGIQNLFDVPTSNSEAPWASRQCPLLAYFWEQGGLSAEQTKHVYRNDILHDDSLFQYPSKKAGAHSPEDIVKWTKFVDSAAKSMTFDSSLQRFDGSIWIVKSFMRFYIASSQRLRRWMLKNIVRIMGYVIGKLLKKAFNAVCVHEGELELLLRAQASALPIIYVPVHRSFMDSIILRWTLVHAGLPVPYSLSSSKNSRFSWLAGGIPRPNVPNISDPAVTDMVRTAAVSSFVKTVLKKGGSLQLMLEGNKSRIGKPSTELYGTELLKVVYDLYESRGIEDAYVVPVSVSYDILPEDSEEWFDFSQSEREQPLGLWSYLRKLWSFSKMKLGSSRISFGQPFGLREFFASMQENKKFHCVASGDETTEVYHKTFESSELNWVPEVGSTASIPSLCGELDMIDFQPFELGSVLPKINMLAFHTMYSASSATAIMSTHVVAFLLVKKFRQGTTLSNLVKEAEDLKRYLEKRKRGFGFTGDMQSTILNALQLLGPDSVSVQLESSGSYETFVAPVLCRENLLRLGYYANQIMPAFAMEAIAAVAAYALVGNQLNVSRGFDFDVRVKDEDLAYHCSIIYRSLATELFLHSPCLLGLSAIRRAFETLNDDCVLQFLMDETVRRNRRFYETEIEEDYFPDTETAVTSGNPQAADSTGDYFFTPYEYKICSSEENINRLRFLKSLLVPTLEIYAVIGKELEEIAIGLDGIKRVDKRTFQKAVLSKLTETFAIDAYGEFLSMDTVKAALFAFESNGVIEISSDRKSCARFITMGGDQESNVKLKQSVNNLHRYVTQ